MSKSKSSKIPYDERSDNQKLLSNWKKATGLYNREDWSASIMRVATATEISANIYIRHYLQEQHSLPEQFVNSLLMSANGIKGKFIQLITPASKCLDTWDEIKSIQRKIESINRHRNGIAHSGTFKNRSDANKVFEKAIDVIACLSPIVANEFSMPSKKN